MRFDPTTHTVGLTRNLDASLEPERPDPAIPVDGLTFGVASMAENSPHGGERHPDGDEILYLISGLARVVFIESDEPETPDGELLRVALQDKERSALERAFAKQLR